MSTPRLTVASVAWNSADALPDCLGALRASAERAGTRLEIVVVDNGSTDGSADTAVAAGADRVIRNPVNAGFAAAAAQAVAAATAPWVVLVNPDLTVDADFVGALEAAADSAAEDVATLVPDLRYTSSPEIVNCRGIGVDDIGIPYERLAGTDAGIPAAPDRVFGGTSGGCAYRVAALRAIGGPEPCFFAFLEDVDVAWRLNRAGYKAVVVPGAMALHEGSASVGEGSWLKSYLVARNRRLLFRLHGPHRFRARVWRTITETGHALVTAAWGARTAPVRGRAAAVLLRRHTRFLIASRGDPRRPASELGLTPRAGLLATLVRKRAAVSRMRRVG